MLLAPSFGLPIVFRLDSIRRFGNIQLVIILKPMRQRDWILESMRRQSIGNFCVVEFDFVNHQREFTMPQND